MGFSNLVNPAIWSISQIVDNIKDGKIVLPRYQRAQVWSNSKRRKLIQSIMQGYPIGSLLVYENKDENNWQLIDGLQRATAIERYQKNPLEFVDLGDLIEGSEKLRDSFEVIFDTSVELGLVAECEKDAFFQAVSCWLPGVKISSPSDYNPLALANAIVERCSELGKDFGGEEQETLLAVKLNQAIQSSSFLDQIKEEVNIDSYSIPVVFYSGNKKNLPDIFDRVNVEGTKLSKYDVLAAVWYGSSSRILIDNKAIKDAIQQKYEQVTKDGFIIDESDHEEDDYTLYEYLFGIGKLLADNPKYEILFKSGRDSTSVESFSFTIACIAYHQKLGEIDKLPDTIREKEGLSENAVIDLSHFFQALQESVNFVCDTLKPYIGIEFQKPFIAHTEYQICSYITRALVGKYDYRFSWKERTNWKNDRKQLEKGIPQHYLYELMTNTWGNAGDSRLYNNVWSGSEPSDAYTHGYTRDEWESAIRTWFNEDLRKKQRSRSSIDAVSKVFLKYIYGTIAQADEEKGRFDIDHIFPVKLLAERLKEDDESEGWPMSAIGNLEFLQSSINQKKNAQTLGDYYNGEGNAPMGMTDKDKREILRRFSLCEDPGSVTFTEGWGEEDFLRFIKQRELILKDKLLKRFDLDS